jgi:cobalt-precorrin-5B (C1)-methyltransferase
MWQETSETVKPLRSGLTTGSCATACCVAACRALFANEKPSAVEITLPRKQVVEMPIKGYQPLVMADIDQVSGYRVEIVKDAGDDPDATHGATLFVELRLIDKTPRSINDDINLPNIVFKAGSGVGTVTKTGLVLAIGEPAINPVPRKMMTEHLINYAQVYGYQGDFEVSIGVVNGQQIAKKTMNSRLGIIGGLSILGTTGIVRPYSCAAYIASIRQGIDVAASNGITHIGASTGSSSEAAIREKYHFSETALIEMGDFVGALLKHLKQKHKDNCGVSKLSICGGFGKMTKLAQGALDLNSRKSSIDFQFLQRCVQELLAQSVEPMSQPAQHSLLEQVLNANTSVQVLSLANDAGLPMADYISYLACMQARSVLLDASTQTTGTDQQGIRVEVFSIDRKGVIVGSCAHFSQQDKDNGANSKQHKGEQSS